jgi:hypothetical protein
MVIIFRYVTLCHTVNGYQCLRDMWWLHLQATTWRWRQQVAPKCLYPSNKLQGVTFLKTIILTLSTVKISLITEWFLYSTVTGNKIYQQNIAVHIIRSRAAPLPGAFNEPTVTDQNTGLTWLHCLDSNLSHVPHALPHLTKRPLSQLAHKRKRTSLDLPLVSCATRQVNLQKQYNITAPCSTVC